MVSTVSRFGVGFSSGDLRGIGLHGWQTFRGLDRSALLHGPLGLGSGIGSGLSRLFLLFWETVLDRVFDLGDAAFVLHDGNVLVLGFG